MLAQFYTLAFRPNVGQRSPSLALAIGGLVTLTLALNAAGQIGSGLVGVIGFTLLFAIATLIGWFWLAAGVNVLARFFGGQGTSGQTLLAIAQGLWPLLLTGPAVAALQWSEVFGGLFSLAVSIGTLLTLTLQIQIAHQFSWWGATLSLVGTLILSFFALFGLIIWPLMLFLGT
jgi:hypothetical protein